MSSSSSSSSSPQKRRRAGAAAQAVPLPQALADGFAEDARDGQEMLRLRVRVSVALKPGSATLIVRDEQSEACKDVSDRKKLLADHQGRLGVAAVLSERARGSLVSSWPLFLGENAFVEISSANIVEFWQQKERAGLLNGISKSEWMEFAPKLEERKMHSRYLEVDELDVIKESHDNENGMEIDTDEDGLEFERRAKAGGWCEVAAVSPPFPGKAVEIFFLFQDVEKRLFCVEGKELIVLQPLLKKGDQVLVEKNVLKREPRKLKTSVDVRKCYAIRIIALKDIVAIKAFIPSFSPSQGVMPSKIEVTTPSIDYIGEITKRIGAFTLELDGDRRCKMFLTMVPSPGDGRGLRVGAEVKLENVVPFYYCGRLEGFQLTLRSSISIVRFSPSRASLSLRHSPTLCAKLLPTGTDSIYSYWYLVSLASYIRKFSGRAVKAKEALQEVARITADVHLVDKRCTLHEFLTGMAPGEQQPVLTLGPELKIQSNEMKLPVIPSVDAILRKVKRGLSSQGLQKYPRHPLSVLTTFEQNFLHMIPSEEMAEGSSEGVALIGWLLTSQRTGELVFRDRTASMEIMLTDSLKTVVLEGAEVHVNPSKDVMAIGMVLDKFDVCVEALNLRTQDGFLISKGDGTMRLWEGQFIMDGSQGNTLLRIYLQPRMIRVLEELEPPRVKISLKEDKSSMERIEKPFRALLVEMGTLQWQAGKEKASVKLKFWTSGETGRGQVFYVTLGNGRFSPFWNFLECGIAYLVSNVAAMTANGLKQFQGTRETTFHALAVNASRNLRKKFCEAFESETFSWMDPISVKRTLQRASEQNSFWAFQGIVTKISLRERKSSTKASWNQNSVVPDLLKRCTAVFIEFRDLESLETIPLYLQHVDQMNIPPGLLRIGSHVVVHNAEFKSENQRIYCRTTLACTRMEVVSTLPLGHTISNSFSADHSDSFLDDLLLVGIKNPKQIAFGSIGCVIAKLSMVLIERRCPLCGWNMTEGFACTKKCVLKPREKGLFMVKVSCTVDDGTSQAQISVDGPDGLHLIGFTNQRLLNEVDTIMHRFQTPKVEFRSNNLHKIPIGKVKHEKGDAEWGRYPQEPKEALNADAQFAKLLILQQVPNYQRFCIFGKCKFNMDNKANSMFQEGNSYRYPIRVRDKDVKTGSLPKLVIHALAVERVTDFETETRKILLSL